MSNPCNANLLLGTNDIRDRILDLGRGTPTVHDSNKALDDIVEMLNRLDPGASINDLDAEGWTLLHWAVDSPMGPDLIPLLIDHGADVNCQSKEGLLPLHSAAAAGNIACIDALQPSALQLSQRDNMGCRPLHYATDSYFLGKSNSPATVMIHLIQLGADLSLKDDNEKTALDCSGRDTIDHVNAWLNARRASAIIDSASGSVPAHITIRSLD